MKLRGIPGVPRIAGFPALPTAGRDRIVPLASVRATRARSAIPPNGNRAKGRA